MRLIDVLLGTKCAECGKKITGARFPAFSGTKEWNCEICHYRLEAAQRQKEEETKQRQRELKRKEEEERARKVKQQEEETARKQKDSKLIAAAACGDMQAIDRSLDAGASVNCLVEGLAPLHVGVMADQEASVKRLIEHGADVNLLSGKGLAPLHYAATLSLMRTTAIPSLLLDAGADVNALGRTPLGTDQQFAIFTALNLAQKACSERLEDFLRQHGGVTVEELIQRDRDAVMRVSKDLR